VCVCLCVCVRVCVLASGFVVVCMCDVFECARMITSLLSHNITHAVSLWPARTHASVMMTASLTRLKGTHRKVISFKNFCHVDNEHGIHSSLTLKATSFVGNDEAA